MAFKLQDFECKDCQAVTEILIDKNKTDQEIKCEKCSSLNMEPILSAGSANHIHVSWSTWRVNV